MQKVGNSNSGGSGSVSKKTGKRIASGNAPSNNNRQHGSSLGVEGRACCYESNSNGSVENKSPGGDNFESDLYDHGGQSNGGSAFGTLCSHGIINNGRAISEPSVAPGFWSTTSSAYDVSYHHPIVSHHHGLFVDTEYGSGGGNIQHI